MPSFIILYQKMFNFSSMKTNLLFYFSWKSKVTTWANYIYDCKQTFYKHFWKINVSILVTRITSIPTGNVARIKLLTTPMAGIIRFSRFKAEKILQLLFPLAKNLMVYFSLEKNLKHIRLCSSTISYNHDFI